MADSRPSVFLSYTRDEVPFVRAVANELQQRGVDVSFDETRLEPGGSWRDTIDDALQSAKVVIVFVTSKTLASSFVNFEIGAAFGREKRIVPVFLTEGGRRDAPRLLSTVGGIDAYDLKPEEVAEQIAEAVNAP